MSGSALTEQLAALEPALTIVDVGVRGGIEETWARLVPHVRVYGFDADQEECARLKRDAPPQLTYVPLALGAHAERGVLYVTDDPACSSLYPPDAATAEQYPALAVTREVARRPVSLQTLDAWASAEGVTTVSYLKLDAQGAELDILRGAIEMLESVFALQTEVEFNPIYLGQPLYGEVDAFMRDHGFVLWRLANLCHYTLKGRSTDGEELSDGQVFAGAGDQVSTVEFVAKAGRLFWADAFYVRREIAEGRLPSERDAAVRAAVVLSALGFRELASICL